MFPLGRTLNGTYFAREEERFFALLVDELKDDLASRKGG